MADYEETNELGNEAHEESPYGAYGSNYGPYGEHRGAYADAGYVPASDAGAMPKSYSFTAQAERKPKRKSAPAAEWARRR